MARGSEQAPIDAASVRSVADWVTFTREQSDGLHWVDSITLGHETKAALQLIAHGRRILLIAQPIDAELEPLFAVLAMGTERLLKISLGHAHLQSNKGWPQYLRAVHGHRIEEMHRRLLKKLSRGLEGPANHDRARTELQALRDDRLLTSLFAALENYATGGRFENLDTLARTGTPRDGALSGWLSVLDVYDDLGLSDVPMQDESWMRQAHATIEGVVGRWLAGIATCAEVGLLGNRGQALAVSIRRAENARVKPPADV